MENAMLGLIDYKLVATAVSHRKERNVPSSQRFLPADEGAGGRVKD
jgi:hypothetical protein